MKNIFKLLLILLIVPRCFLHGEDMSHDIETETVYLSGRGSDDAVEWDFYCTDGRKSGQWDKILVPSCWEQQGFGSYNYGIYFYGKPTDPAIPAEQGKYRHSFEVPKAWENKNVQIIFEASMTDTEVRINGKKAGEIHQGAFYRFKYDITPWLKFGKENLLEVTVSKESENASVNLSERRADYWNFGGIFRPVFLEVKPAQYIERTAIDAKADGQFLAEVYFGYALSCDYSVVAEVIDDAGKTVGKTIETKVRGGADKVVLQSQFADVKLWTAETPNLYNVRFSLKKDNDILHTVNDSIGFRTFEIRKKDGIYLNGKRIIMRGVNRHSFWPETGRTLNKTLNYEDVRLIKEMNMNSVRMAHYPPDPEFLDACDEMGLYVLNELGGWHGHYDTGVGVKLVREMVIRDVNHACVLLWDNGNEGGWNTELDVEFAKWDPQNRPVIHPQQDLNGLETMHYRSYGETQEYLRGKDLFMPTEFLHGLYDGGLGAGLYDYWNMMYSHPNCTGGFLWVYADEGVVRTDQAGRIDNDGNHGADGIVGPHHEKEGSFFTIKEVWSPIQIEQKDALASFNGELVIENRYDFTNLNQCHFKWQLCDYPNAFDQVNQVEIIAQGKGEFPNTKVHTTANFQLSLPQNWQQSDALLFTAYDPDGLEVWTWSWTIAEAKSTSLLATATKEAYEITEKDMVTTVSINDDSYSFSQTNGYLLSVLQDGKTMSFGNGPRFVAVRRADRSLDGWVAENLPKGVDRIYNNIELSSSLKSIRTQVKDDCCQVEVLYTGALSRVIWSIYTDGTLALDYTYRFDGVVELMGISFDYPEEKMKSIKWLGKGPYRVWQNRVHGTTLGIWDNDYNDPIPGESFIYPEFKGYFHHWQWARFTTDEGVISIANNNDDNFLGVYTPRDGRDALLYTIPQTGIAVFDVIPAVRNKVNTTDLIGPSSQAKHVSGQHNARLTFKFQNK